MRVGMVAAIVLALTACGDDIAATQRILFIRGGSGTAGFVEGGTDDHLSSIADTTTAPFNRGYGQLAELLRSDGFVVEEVAEGPAAANTPVDLSDITDYAVVVFGSNNAVYTADDAARVAAYVEAGGGALFISDANWGSFWDKAPTSDQTFLTQFGLVMNQDGGGLIRLSGAEFLDPAHPILDGVDELQGEGVSPCTVTGVPAVRLVVAKDVVRRNTAPMGPVEAPTDADASVAVVEHGAGRVACHFDRNTFFNDGGAGTNVTAASNAAYAGNLFAWLAGRR